MNHLSDAERQAHAAGEFDEATAMRRASSPPAEDLEQVLAELQRDLNRHVNHDVRPSPSRVEAWRDQVEVLRAALERLSQREDVIARLDREVEGHIELAVETQRSRDAALARERELREALEELVETDEDYDVDTMTQWPVSQPVGSGEKRGKAMITAKALLAQPAAGEERERG